MAMAVATAVATSNSPYSHLHLRRYRPLSSTPAHISVSTVPHPPPLLSDFNDSTSPPIDKPNNNKKSPSMRARLSQLCQQGRPDLALRLFDTISRPNTVLWNTVIIGFICNGLPYEALRFYARMAHSSPLPKFDSYTYSSALKACADTRQFSLGKSLHCRILRTHSKLTRIVGNSLLNMYSSCLIPGFALTEDEMGPQDGEFSRVDLVQKVFDKMGKRNAVSWNTMIGWYVRTGRPVQALKQFKLMMTMGIKPTAVSFVNVFPAVAASEDQRNCNVLYGLLLKFGSEYVNDLFVVSSAISTYSELSDVESARLVFGLSTERNTEVWNTMIGGYVQNGCYEEGLDVFLRVLDLDDIVPDTVTFLAALTAISQLQRLEFGQQIHAYVVKNSMASETIILNALIAMYSKCDSIMLAFKVFEKMLERDSVSWNTMISAFVQNGLDSEGLMLVYEMQKQGYLLDSITMTALLSAASNIGDSDIGRQTHGYLFRHGIRFEGMDSYLIDMYAKSGLIKTSQWLFENTCAQTRDQVTWNAMIAGYTQNGQVDQSFSVLHQMLELKQTPNAVTLASILPACNPLGGISVGKQIHGYAIRHSMDHNVFVGTALVDMYSKCGAISYAEKVCGTLPEKNSVTYTTMILGYGQHGLGERALFLFNSLSKSGMRPDAVTFVAILSACSYAGLVDEGIQIFFSMESEYSILPTPEHYCCVVDMLGRAGRVSEAYAFVKQLGDRGNIAGIWGSLLGACRIHGELEVGKLVASRLLELEEGNGLAGYHVLLSNIFADEGMWENANKVRENMKEKGVRKEAGCSWIEIGGTVNCFISKDQKHPQSHAIYSKLEQLTLEMKAAGYRPALGCYNSGIS